MFREGFEHVEFSSFVALLVFVNFPAEFVMNEILKMENQRFFIQHLAILAHPSTVTTGNSTKPFCQPDLQGGSNRLPSVGPVTLCGLFG